MAIVHSLRFRQLWLIALLGLSACAHQDTRTAPPASSLVGYPSPGSVSPMPESGTDKVIVHTLPVGAGNCQLLQCPSQDRMIIFDCGSTGVGEMGWSADKVKLYVDNLIKPSTEIYVALSHSDSDHGNYLPTVFPDRKVQGIYLGGQRSSYVQAVKNWINSEELNGAAVVSYWPNFYQSQAPEAGLSCWVSDGNGGVKVDVGGYILGVNGGASANAYSMVVASVYDKFQMVFTGDMTGATEDAIGTTSPVTLSDTDVITGAHHGADTAGSNSTTWVAANKAQTVIFSAGDKHEHPRCNSVDRYLGYLSPAPKHGYHCGTGDGYETRSSTKNIFVTDDNGLIIVKGSTNGDANISWQVSGESQTADAKPTPRSSRESADTVEARTPCNCSE